MSDRAPRWARALLERSAGPKRVDEVVGDLDEAHRLRVGRHGRILAAVLTGLEAIDMARALRRARCSRPTDVAPAARHLSGALPPQRVQRGLALPALALDHAALGPGRRFRQDYGLPLQLPLQLPDLGIQTPEVL